jgi:hypothetical protein
MPRTLAGVSSAPASGGCSIESLACDLSSCCVELHDLAGAFAVAIEIGFVHTFNSRRLSSHVAIPKDRLARDLARAYLLAWP